MPNSVQHKRMTYLLTSLRSHFSKEQQPLQLLNKPKHLNLQRLFPNAYLRLFLTLPASVASAEISFKLSIETENSKKLDYSSMFDPFTDA